MLGNSNVPFILVLVVFIAAGCYFVFMGWKTTRTYRSETFGAILPDVDLILSNNKSKSSEDFVFYYDGVTTDPYHSDFVELEATFTLDSLRYPYYAKENCNFFVQKLTRLRQTDYPILLTFDHYNHGVGNYLSEYFETLSIAVKLGIAFGRVTRTVQSGSEEIKNYLPNFILPKVRSNKSISEVKLEAERVCSTIFAFPHEKNSSLMWRNDKLLAHVNDEMVNRYVRAAKPSLALKLNKTTNQVALHFRCRDNLQHYLYGILRKSVILYLIKASLSDEKIDSLVIFSDATVYTFGSTCQRLLKVIVEQSQLLMRKPFTVSTDLISSPSHVYASLHLAKATICSVSTFCYFATLGFDSNVKYLPRCSLIYPTTVTLNFNSSRAKYFTSTRLWLDTTTWKLESDFNNMEADIQF